MEVCFRNYKNGKSSINGYLEDYAFFIEALTGLYEVTFDETWLNQANELMQYSIEHFFNPKNGMLFFTSNTDRPLFARKLELSDNVIPASNSSIAKSLFMLSYYFENDTFLQMSKQMLRNIQNELENYGSGYSNWGMLMLHFVFPFYEVAISGKDAEIKRKELNEFYFPNLIFSGSIEESNLPLLKGKYLKDDTFVYLCKNKVCDAPVKDVKTIIQNLQVTSAT